MARLSTPIRFAIASGVGVLIGIALMTASTLWSQRTPTLQLRSGFVTVDYLAQSCRACEPASPNADPLACNFCSGMLSGVIDALNDGESLCLAENWTNRQGAKLFLAWAERHADAASMPAAEGIARAHAAEFACHSKRGRSI